ncbi:MAG: mandelate racemase/muconate lactonizing enzyme family protein [Planctomycetes bacterium]|nr:mandelate racemase/muconate lactonizing enzyme family protein [Planctomycetota bacterium]
MPQTPFNIEPDEYPGIPNARRRHLPAVPLEDDAVRITAIETTIPPSYGPHLLFLRIHTDAGIIGHGEGFFCAEPIAAMIHGYMSRRLLGADALAIESHWRFLYERHANIGARGVELRAISAIDLALWDIMGQSCNKPVYRLLGGPVRDRIRVYNSCANPTYSIQPGAEKPGKRPGNTWPGMGSVGRPGPLSDSYNYFHNPVELAKELISLGYSAMKVWPLDLPAIEDGPGYLADRDLRQAVRPLEKIREAVGMDIDVMIDGHAHFQLPVALQIAEAFRPLRPFWLEDVLKMDNLDTLADFRRQSRMPISASEMLLCAPDYAQLMEKRAADYVMIDPTWVGGISETMRIGHLAQAYNLPVSMHDATGPLTLFAGLHALAALPNGLYQETVRAQIAGAYKDLIDVDVQIRDGSLPVPRGPGLGVKINPDLFRPDAPGYRITRL